MNNNDVVINYLLDQLRQCITATATSTVDRDIELQDAIDKLADAGIIIAKLKAENADLRSKQIKGTELVLQQSLDDGWFQWFGGPCPVDGDVAVEVVLRDLSTQQGVSSSFQWGHDAKPHPGDIMQYRVVECEHVWAHKLGDSLRYCIHCKKEKEVE